MNIGDQVIKDVLPKNFITAQIQSELEKTNLINLKNQLFSNEWHRSKENMDDALKLKHERVLAFMEKSSLSMNYADPDLPKRRMLLVQKVANHVKTVLKILDVSWSIIEELKYRMEKDKDIQLDEYYASFVDSLLYKVKILHISVLIATYDDEQFLSALESLRDLLTERYIDAQKTLEYTTKQLKEYKEIGPEFDTLKEAYQNLLDKIQATNDDISRINDH
ncbi:hypothetical protein INT47_007174 [Mucor saturninus]|uniref:Uncharacterized protein n=1 Tax=Mucor saturninus TaxID=64648 RepID=A0A8H7V8S3_9FUNG|nr:hypothetical protein INT47_007174 [Mucor saturninus]